MPYIYFAELSEKLINIGSPSSHRALDIASCVYETHKGFRIYQTFEGAIYTFRFCLTEAGVDHFAAFDIQQNSFSLRLFMPDEYRVHVLNNIVLAGDANNWVRINGRNIAEMEKYAIVGLVVVASHLRGRW